MAARSTVMRVSPVNQFLKQLEPASTGDVFPEADGKTVMTGSGKLLSLLLLGMSFGAAGPVFAQTAHTTLAAVSPQPSPAARAPSPTSAHKITNSWVCASGMRLEMLPVSFDDPTMAKQFVVVYKQDGEVIASERIDAHTARNFPAYGCNDHDIVRRSELLG